MNQTRIAQRIRKLFGEKRIALGLLLNKRHYCLGQFLHTQTLAYEREHVIGGQGRQSESLAMRNVEEWAICERQRFSQWSRDDHEQQGAHTLADLRSQRPRHRIEPMGIFEDKHFG